MIAILPEAFDGWLAERRVGAPGHDPVGTPWFASSQVPGCSEQHDQPTLDIVEPTEGAVLWAGRDADVVELRAELRGTTQEPDVVAPEVEFVIDGEVVARSAWPYRVLLTLPPGDHEVHARPVDRGTRLPTGAARFSVR